MNALVSVDYRQVSDDEVQKLSALAEALEPGSGLSTLVFHLISALSRGVDVALLSEDQQLTSNQAADLLQMSRPHLVRLIEQGLIEEEPRTGSHRRIRMSAIADFLDRRERARADVAAAVGNRETSGIEIATHIVGRNPELDDQFVL